MGVLLLPLTLAGTLLLCGVLGARLPPRWRQPGHEVLILLPLLLLVTLLTLWLPTLLIPDAGNWLPHYEQRNLLVAALAMGFALVPLIFTLSEDALFRRAGCTGAGLAGTGRDAVANPDPRRAAGCFRRYFCRSDDWSGACRRRNHDFADGDRQHAAK